jgi:hypothetical protein
MNILIVWMTNTNKRGLYGNFNNVDYNQKYNSSYLFIKQFNPDMDIIHSRKKKPPQTLKPLKARIKLVRHKCTRRKHLIKKYFGSKSNSKLNSNSKCKSNYHRHSNYQHWARQMSDSLES